MTIDPALPPPPRTRQPATIPGSPPPDLAARLFRALYADLDLHTIGGIHIAIPKGASCYAGRTLSQIARQVSDRRQHPGPLPQPALDTRPQAAEET